MGYLFLGLALLTVVLILAQWFVRTDPRAVARVLRYMGALVLGLLALRFAFAGNLGLAAPLAAGALALFGFRLGGWWGHVPGLGGLGPGAGPDDLGGPSGRTSTVETRYLRMTLDHDSGAIDGTVIEGQFRGRQLAEMTIEALLQLLEECRAADADSAALLETYLDRVHGPDWRTRKDAGSGAPRPDLDDSPMTREQAYKVLGLEPGADEDAIRQAYRRLMARLHPDHGGSDYLAAKINQARDVLLGR